MAAGNLAKDPGGLRMLLSELPKFIIIIGAFFVVAWLIAPRFDATIDHMWQTIGLSFRQIYRYVKGKSQLSGYEKLGGTGDFEQPK